MPGTPTARPPLVLARHPSRMERAALRRLAAAAVLALAGTLAVLALLALADRDGALLRVLGTSLGVSAAVVGFVGLAYLGILGMVLLLEPLSRAGRLRGYLLEGALHAVLPFAMLSVVLAVVHELPEGGALHARAVPVIAILGAAMGGVRWLIAGRDRG